MERVKQWIESHPYLTGALVLGVILLWYVRRNAASSAQSAPGTVYTGPSDALQAAELQSAYGLQTAQIQANAQNDALQAALTGQALQYGAAVQIAGFQTQAQLQSILSAADVSNNQTAASLALGLANIGQPYSFQGAIGGLNFQGGAAVAPTTVVNTTTQTQQQQTAAQTQNQVLAATPSVVQTSVLPLNPVLSSGNAIATSPTTLTPTSGTPDIYGVLAQGSQGNTYVLPTVAQGAPIAPGGNYESTYGVIPGGIQNPFNQFGVAQQTANVNAAETAYVNDPNSCHNSTSPNCTPLYGA